MKHFIIVLFAGIITLTLVLLWYRPGALEEIWLWVIGLIAPVIGLFQFIIEKLHVYLKKFDTKS